MSTGLLVTLALLTAGFWVMLKLVRGHGTRVRMRRQRGRPNVASGLSPADRRRLYRRLGLDPATLRHSHGRPLFGLGPVALRPEPKRSDAD